LSSSLARVAAVHRGGLELITETGPRAGFVTGRLRHGAASADLPEVGDWVTCDPESGAVHAVRERTSALVRAAKDGRAAQILAANVDVVVVVASLTRELNLGRIERMLTLAADAPADAVVVLSKADLVADPAAQVAEVRAALGGAVPVLPVSSVDGSGLDAVAALLGPGVTGVLLGASGVGKTSLLNALTGGERDRPDSRGRRPRAPHDDVARARPARRRRRRHRHAGAQAAAHLGAGERAGERVLGRRGARAHVPLRGLPARRRARLRGGRGGGAGPRAQLPQAAARGAARHAQRARSCHRPCTTRSAVPWRSVRSGRGRSRAAPRTARRRGS